MKKTYNIFILLSIILVFGGCINNSNKTNQLTSEKLAVKNLNEGKKDYPDSTDFWINENYLSLISSGNDVCECLAKNEFVILYLNFEKKTVLIQSSTYFFGLETASEMEMKVIEDKLNYIVAKQWPLSDSLIIKVLGDKLTIDYGKDKIHFKKHRLKTLDIPSTPKGIFTYDSEIWSQLNTLNSKSLLAYRFTDTKNQLISFGELKGLIEDKKVTISCSDDYQYNSMCLKKDSTRYFHLEYIKNKLTIYELPNGRTRHEKVNLKKLKKQEFFKEIKE
ncbi:MAG: hypothetical protein WCP69_02810 [Bacteroidota bacterium]